jgi:hypothetical protein
MLKGGFTADTTEVADLYFQVLPIALFLNFWLNMFSVPTFIARFYFCPCKIKSLVFIPLIYLFYVFSS